MLMSSTPRFEVESVSEIRERDQLVLVRRLDDVDFFIDDHAFLDGARIAYAKVPRILDDNGQARHGVWGFVLADAEDAVRFHPGKVVTLKFDSKTRTN